MLISSSGMIVTDHTAASTAPVLTALYLHADPQQEVPCFYVFLELPRVLNPTWIFEEDMDLLEIWAKEAVQLCLNQGLLITAKYLSVA